MRTDRRPNKQIRKEVVSSGMHFWELAAALNISESTLYRILRTPLSESQKAEIRKIVQEMEL